MRTFFFEQKNLSEETGKQVLFSQRPDSVDRNASTRINTGPVTVQITVQHDIKMGNYQLLTFAFGGIMRNAYTKYDGKTYREIGWQLRYRNIPEPIINQTLAAIREWRAKRTADNRRERERKKAWDEVISALQHERRIVRSMVRYKTATPAPERDAFVQDYFDALNTLYEKLLAGRNKPDENKKLRWPEHSHWTDFVPARVKQAFAMEADDIPPRQKAKFKRPFERTAPVDLHHLRQGRLLRKARKDLLAVQQTLSITPDNEQAKRKLHALETALLRIREMDHRAHVPNHWADMVPELLVKNKTDEDDEM